jgi:hypothetical protein
LVNELVEEHFSYDSSSIAFNYLAQDLKTLPSQIEPPTPDSVFSASQPPSHQQLPSSGGVSSPLVLIQNNHSVAPLSTESSIFSSVQSGSVSKSTSEKDLNCLPASFQEDPTPESTSENTNSRRIGCEFGGCLEIFQRDCDYK